MSYAVLIVDDSAIIRQMVRKAIAMSGLDVGEVHEAANGREALEVLGKHWIDVVLADLNMPEMNGVELVERMAQDNLLVSTPVVIVSSEQSETRINELKRRGVRAYIRKPFRPENFKEVVAQVLGPAKGDARAA
ncbi:MAG TPA: response regulator [Candidatus Saccharimonadales bacterium]|nr:response regulator [Candidatus Saccharimonadales bacterium]